MDQRDRRLDSQQGRGADRHLIEERKAGPERIAEHSVGEPEQQQRDQPGSDENRCAVTRGQNRSASDGREYRRTT